MASSLGNLALSGWPFDAGATVSVAIAGEGEDLHALDADPQIHLFPAKPIPAGWCRITAKIEGHTKNPRLYFDYGEGMSEPSSIRLEGVYPYPWCAVAWLPAPALRIRFDPTNEPCAFKLGELQIEPLGRNTAAILARREFTSLPGTGGMQHVPEAPVLPADDFDANTAMVFSGYSHFSGMSLLLGIKSGVVTVEVYGVDGDTPRLLRTVSTNVGEEDIEQWRHVYWEPIADSLTRFYLVRYRLDRDGEPVAFPGARIARDARPIHSHPQSWSELPHAVVFSPVSQCNLNCTHCISRPTRDRKATASDHVWSELETITRTPEFSHIATDYSGDILFNEVRNGGLLSRLIAMDAAYRVDTNANCLEDDIIEKLVHSKLKEINFSLDSMDPEAYLRVRRGSVPLPDVLAKIARFAARQRVVAPHIRTVLSFVLMRSTAHTIAPAFAFAKEHGIQFVNVFPLIAFTDDMVDEVFIWDETGYAALYKALMAESARTGVGLSMQAPSKGWNERDGHTPCTVAWGSAVLMGNGDVMACCVPGSRIGSLEGRSLREFWNGPEYQSFRLRVNTPDPPAPCRNCPMNRIPNNRKAYAPAKYQPLADKVVRLRPTSR